MHWFCHAGCVPEQAGRPRSGVRGRTLTAGASLGAALVLASGAPALAEEAVATVPAEAAPTVRCQISDPRLAELSGLVAVGDQLLAVNDGGDQAAVHLLDAACQVVDVHTAAVDPYDPRTWRSAPTAPSGSPTQGTTTPSGPRWPSSRCAPDGTTGVYRLSYPDGPHDAEALLLAPDGTPYLVTKEVLGASKVYRPASALVTAGRSRWSRWPP